jgi:uncharacterized protein
MQWQKITKFKNIWYNGSDESIQIEHGFTGDIGMENRYYIGVLISVAFTMMLFLLSRGIYTPFFVLLVCLFLSIIFLKENNRIFTWILLAFFIGNVTAAYGDQFLDNYHLSPMSNGVISQMLGLIPIVFVLYILKQFKQKVWQSLSEQRVAASVWKWFLIFSGLLLLVILGMLFFQKENLSARAISFLLLLSIIHALVDEVLWRGLLLPQFMKTIGKTWGLMVSSIAFGLSSTMFGISVQISILYILLGFLFTFLTLKTNSILPAFVVHSLVTIIILLSGMVILPI